MECDDVTTARNGHFVTISLTFFTVSSDVPLRTSALVTEWVHTGAAILAADLTNG